MSNTRKDLLKLEDEMNQKFINRRSEIRGLMVSMLARGNMVLLGQAGTAKTDLVQTLARAIKCDCFETLLTRTSSPEELFGAYDIAKLQEGRYVRNVENTLATADFAFVDEVFKCNSATLNGLLGVMAQRTFRNGNALPTPIPLQLLVGASNEMPEGGAEGELSALWDRFEMRFVVDYIKDEGSFIKLLNISGNLEPKTQVDMSDIIKAQGEVKSVNFSGAEQLLVSIWRAMKQAGFRISDRKWRNSLRYMAANAWLEGRTDMDEEDLSLLNNMLWQTPEQIKPIRKLVGQFVNPELNKAQDEYDAACEIMAKLEQFTDDDAYNREHFDGATRAGYSAEAHGKLTRARKSLMTMKSKLEAKGKNTKALQGYIDDIGNMIVRVSNFLFNGTM